MITDIRLLDGDREMSLWDRDDLRVTGLDIPFPEVRAVVEPLTGSDGTEDTTAFFGSRAASVNIRLLDNSSAALDELSAFLHPSARPYLYIADDDWGGERRLRLRVQQASSPIQMPLYPFARDVQAQWVVPSGVWESATETEFVVNADFGELVGRSYELEPPRIYTETMAAGLVEHTNPGTWQHQKVRLYGPCVGPRYSNDTTGETFAFTDALVIPAGDYVEIDTAARTALYLSDPDASRLSFVDYAVSTWWRLAPGMNRVRYHPIAEVGAGSIAVVSYRPAWLS